MDLGLLRWTRAPLPPHVLVRMLCSGTLAQQAPPITPPVAPPIALAAPMPPPPALPAGLRALLEGTGCIGACLERGEDWFESERPNLGVLSSVSAMVRANLADNFLESLRPLEPAAEALLRRRLDALAAQQHVHSGRRLGGGSRAPAGGGTRQPRAQSAIHSGPLDSRA